MQVRNALIFQPKDFACLATRRDFKLALIVETWHFYFGTKSRLSKIYGQFVDNIITITSKELVLGHRK